MSLEILFIATILAEGAESFVNARTRGVDSAYFEVPVAREIWKFLEEYYKSNKKLPGVEYVRMKFDLEDLSSQSGVSSSDLTTEICDKYLFGEVNELGVKIKGSLDSNNPKGAFEILTEFVREKQRKIDYGVSAKSYSDLLPDVFKKYQDYKAGISGISTPWGTIQNWTTGWHAQDVSFIIGRPGVGKTWSILECVRAAVVLSEAKTGLFSAEMSASDIAQRYFCLRNQVPYGQYRKGQLSIQSELLLKELTNSQSVDDALMITDGSKGVSIDAVEQMIIKGQFDILFIDAVYRIKPRSKSRDRFEAMASVIDDLKLLAQTYNVSIVASSQFNRELNKRDVAKDGLDLSDVALSDVIGWTATNVLGLIRNREDVDKRQMKIYPLKVREGASGDPVYLNWDFSNMNFTEKEKDEEEEVGW